MPVPQSPCSIRSCRDFSCRTQLTHCRVSCYVRTVSSSRLRIHRIERIRVMEQHFRILHLNHITEELRLYLPRPQTFSASHYPAMRSQSVAELLCASCRTAVTEIHQGVSAVCHALIRPASSPGSDASCDFVNRIICGYLGQYRHVQNLPLR